jgi:hypothetical protein
MRHYVIWAVLGLPTSALLVFGMPPAALSRNDVRREWREGMREIRRERREAAREILNADTPAEFRREIREGVREVRREKREMRRAVRREIRQNVKGRLR